MDEYKVTIYGNDGYIRTVAYFTTEAEANRYANKWLATGWNVEVEEME